MAAIFQIFSDTFSWKTSSVFWWIFHLSLFLRIQLTITQPGQRQAIICTNAGILLIWPLGTNFSEILIKIHAFLFKKMHLKMPSAKCSHFVSASMCWVIVKSRVYHSFWRYLCYPHDSDMWSAAEPWVGGSCVNINANYQMSDSGK